MAGLAALNLYLAYAGITGAVFAARMVKHDIKHLGQWPTNGTWDTISKWVVITAHGVVSLFFGAAFAPVLTMEWIANKM